MGRRSKPAAIKQAQGNPGRRPIPDVAPAAEEMPTQPIAASAANIAKITDDAQRVFDLIGSQLRRMNFLRDSDELAFWRYCETMARYWRVTEQLDSLGGETYECETTNGGKMLRLRPQFVVQERLARRLEGLEDRFGLTPRSRQEYILALQRQPGLPLDPPPQRVLADPKPAPAGSSTPRPAAIGGLRGPLN